VTTSLEIGQSFMATFISAWETGTRPPSERSSPKTPSTTTVTELNRRTRSQRIAAGVVVTEGVSGAGGQTAEIGDQIITRQNHRQLAAAGR
jgi:hypothetical protein